MIIIIVAFSGNEPNSGNEPKKPSQAEIVNIPIVTSVQLASDYEKNTISADEKYKGKQFKISGRVTDINTDFLGNPYITMTGTNQFLQPQFKFPSDQKSQLATLQKGMNLTLLCTGAGDVVKTPMSEDCQIVP